MKATELIIGDWILLENRPVKVVRLPRFCIPSFGGNVIWISPHNDGSDVECHNISEISYISLTPEILEKNGWECSNSYMIKRTADGLFYWVEDLGVVFYKNSYNMRTCEYVHQLQHALHLCGLSEIADNFKV